MALVVGLTLFNIPFQLVHNQTLCSGAACPSDQLSPAAWAQLQRAGLSLGLYAGYPVVLNTVFVLVFVVVAGLIFWRKSSQWYGVWAATALPLVAFSLTASGTPPPGIVDRYPGLLVPIQLLTMLGFIALYMFFYLFPDGHFTPRWSVWLVPLVVAHEVLFAFRPALLGSDPYVSLLIVSVLAAQIYRFWRVSNVIQRQQTKWVVFGSTVAGAGAIVLTVFLPLLYPDSQSAGAGLLVTNTAWSLLMLLIPLSIGMAILRSRLWDIDLLIRRTLVYAALTALLALVYFGSVVALQSLFTALTGQQRSELVTVLSTLAIAALFVPLRNRLQALIDRRFYRRKYDAARTLAAFGAALRDEVDLDELSEHLLGVVDETMQPETVALWLVKR